jgi:hypothetical protein
MRLQRDVSAFINFYVKNAFIFDMMIAVNQKREQKVNLVLIHNKATTGNTKNTTRRKRSRVRHTITTAPRKPTADDRPIDEGRTEKKKNKMKNTLLTNLLIAYFDTQKRAKLFKDNDTLREIYRAEHLAIFSILFATYHHKVWQKLADFKRENNIESI